MRKGLQRLLGTLLTLVLCLGLLPGSGTSAATLPLPTEKEAIELLQFYQVARGDENGDLQLEKTLTRAEAATLFVRALGKESEVGQRFDLSGFTDTVGHWGAPWAALAVQLNLMLGDGNGRFRPDDTITYAEILTVLMRMTDQPLPNPWSPEAAFAAAQAIGIAPLGTQPAAPAVRAKVFWALGSTISRIPLANGKTLIQLYLDTIPPDLTVDQSEIVTRDPAISITGTSFEAVTLTIDGRNLQRDKSGRFTYKATLKPGTTAFDLVATDKVGNTTEKQVVVTVLPPVSTITVTGPNNFAVGTENKLEINVTDTLGQPVDHSELSFTMTGDVATYDPIRQTLHAGNIPGKGTLVLRAGRASRSFAFTIAGPSVDSAQLEFTQINGGRALPTGKDVQIQVQVKNAGGRLQTTDNFRPITFKVEGLGGVTPTERIVQTTNGVAVLTVNAAREGSATITATAAGLSVATANVQFLSSPRIVLTPKVTTLAADGTATTTLTAQLQDENGRAVNAPTGLLINLTTGGAGATLSAPTLTIQPGKSASDTVTIQSGINPGTLTISGQVTVGPAYSVQFARIELSGQVAGTQLVIAGPTSAAPDVPVELTVQVLDNLNQPVKSGSYAFQVKVESIPAESTSGGLPEGATLTFIGSDLMPIDDGKAPSDTENNPKAVIGRTINGKAELRLTYKESGRLRLSVITLAATPEAYDSSGSGPAISTNGFGTLPLEVTFQGGAAAIRLTATSNLGANLPAATIGANRTLTLRAEVVDENGFVLKNQTPEISLSKVAGLNISNPVSALTKKAVAGVAEFQVATNANYGYDIYKATAPEITDCSSLPVQAQTCTITVANRQERALTPQIEELRGYPSGTPGKLLPSDTHLQIRLFPQDAQFSKEPTNWVVAKVFRKGESGALVSNVALDLLRPTDTLLVPRDRLRVGTATYEVVVNNGTGDSARSPDLGFSSALTQAYSSNYRISGASFDAASGRLLLNSSGLATTGNVDVSKLVLVALETNQGIVLDPARVQLTGITASSISLDLGAQAAQLNPDLFYGAVKIVAADGWYDAGPAGSVAKAIEYTGLKPMARISHAALDLTGKFLYLYGTGLKQGTLDLGKLHLQQPGLAPVTLLPGSTAATDRVVAQSETEVKISLSPTSLAALAALSGSELVIGADVGWLWSGSANARFNAPALTSSGRPLYAWVQVTAVSYVRATRTLTLTGKNLAGATIHLSQLGFNGYGAKDISWPEMEPGESILTPPVTATSDTKVEIILDPADALSFERKYEGRQLYLNTVGDWFFDASGRKGLPLAPNTLLLSVRSS